jgi:predicted phosphate transport protein (TIGR00153 family)
LLVRFPAFSFGGRERSILQGIEDHLSLVKTCVTTFESLVEAVASEDATVTSLNERVFELQTEADQMKRDIESKIAEGAFFGGVREDMLGLIGEINSIAKSAKDSTRLLVVGTQGDSSGDGILKDEHMSKFLATLLESLTALQAVVGALQTNRKAVVSGVHAVQECEERADLEKAALLAELFKFPRTLDPVLTIQLRDFILAADDIADNAENASDVLLVLVAKGYG